MSTADRATVETLSGRLVTGPVVSRELVNKDHRLYERVSVIPPGSDHGTPISELRPVANDL